MKQKGNHRDFLRIRREILVCLFLVVTTIAVYWQTRHYDFVNFDDYEYVKENPHVQNGITPDGIIWAFTAFHSGNWHPLTWLSHMLDCQLFGLNPGMHHLINLLFHIANTLLLFFVFKKMTGGLWESAFIAALFALHPLHVESVAWISERKDVLSTFFFMLTMWSYIRYVKRPSLDKYILLLLFFIFGLMSKPMLVTLPFVLLLLDFWPLCRLRFKMPADDPIAEKKSTAVNLILEKLPLFILAAISCVITFNAQKYGGSITSLAHIPLEARMGNALVSYLDYIIKMIYPSKLAVLYPYPLKLSWWLVTGATLILASISFFAIKTIKQRPYLTVGWLWYLGTLVPVIGLIQVGRQSMADRYTYIPLVGLFIIIAWGVPGLFKHRRFKKPWLITSATITLSILTAVTWKQIGYWKNSITLFEHTLHVTSNNYLAHNNLGLAVYNHGQTNSAIKHYLQALRINPNYVEAHNNLGMALSRQGHTGDAIKHYLKALRLKPDIAEIHFNLGLALYKEGRTDDAIKHYLQALKTMPDIAEIHFNLGMALYKKGRIDDAIKYYLQALTLKPDLFEAHNNLANALYQKGETDDAIKHYRQALKIRPNCPEIYNNLGVAFISGGDLNKAITCFHAALSIKPDYPSAKNNLKKALLMQKQNE